MNTTESDGNFTYNPEYLKRGTKVFSTLLNIDSKINYTIQINNITRDKFVIDLGGDKIRKPLRKQKI